MRNILGVLIFFLVLNCSNSYDTFKTVPNYITNANTEQKAFFDAYDKSLSLWDVSYEELFIPTSNGTAHVIISGPKRGKPVVLLHGMNATSTMWYPNIEALSSEFRVFAIDFILEPGKSLMTSNIEDVDKISDWYFEVFTALELEQFHIIGASRGGWLAVDYALKHRQQVKSLTLLSPAQTLTWIKPSVGLFKTIISVFSSEEKRIEQTLETMSSNVNNINSTYIDQYHIAAKSDSLNKFVINMKPFSNNELKTLKIPVLVLIGDDDMINDSSSIDIVKKHMPYGHAEIIPQSGHFLSIDQAKVVNRKMIEFIKSQK